MNGGATGEERAVLDWLQGRGRAHSEAVEEVIGLGAPPATARPPAAAPPIPLRSTPAEVPGLLESATAPTPAPAPPVSPAPAAPQQPISIEVPPPCVDVPQLLQPAVACPAEEPPPAERELRLPQPEAGRFEGSPIIARFARDLASCYATRRSRHEVEHRHRAAIVAAEREARRAAAGLPPDERDARVREARGAVDRPARAEVEAELFRQREQWLAGDYEATLRGALGRYGDGWLIRMRRQVDTRRRRARGANLTGADLARTLEQARCDQERWAVQEFNRIRRGWMVGRREEVDFQTLMPPLPRLSDFAPPPPPTTQLVPIDPLGDGTPVAPETREFLRNLHSLARRRFRANNYAGHGGGSFRGRGYSLDLYLDEPLDERGFYPRASAAAFLFEVDQAARVAGVRWRVLYNDYAVAQHVNRRLARIHVLFVGTSRGDRNLNWHGPLILHFHLDLASPVARRPTEGRTKVRHDVSGPEQAAPFEQVEATLNVQGPRVMQSRRPDLQPLSAAASGESVSKERREPGATSQSPQATGLLPPELQLELPFLLAGPIVRRTEPRSVWFWFACSQEIRDCKPRLSVYNRDGSLRTRWMDLESTQPQVVRLGERLWVALVEARPKGLSFSDDFIYGYDLTIQGPASTTTLLHQLPQIAYKPFDRPTFIVRTPGILLPRWPFSRAERIVHGSCRRPGGYGQDAFLAFDDWLTKQILAGAKGKRPPSMILTGDQIYADDVAYPLFQGVRRLAEDVFGYAEQLPTLDGTGTNSVDNFPVNDWRNLPEVAAARKASEKTKGLFGSVVPADIARAKRLTRDADIAVRNNSRAGLTRRQLGKPDQPGTIGFTTEDGQGHLLSFAEYAAMYLLCWNDELWKRYVRPKEKHPTDNDTNNLLGFEHAIAASRRVLANIATYMLFDDHEITDDWNLDGAWEQAVKNPMAQRIISNGLAAYWAFQAWGNDPSQFDPTFINAITRHLMEMSAAKGGPGFAARSYDDVLHAKHWSYVAPTMPPALCVDTRTRREFPPNESAVLCGKKRCRPHLERLIGQHLPEIKREAEPKLRRGEPLLIVLPTPFLPHRSFLYAQAKTYPRRPVHKYEGDYESYGNNPDQRPDFIAFLRQQLDPPAVIVFSGDVHHGSLVSGLYVGGPRLDDIYEGKGTWAMRVIQVTSSAIKNIKVSAFVDPHWTSLTLTDAGNLGEMTVPRYENQFKTMLDRTKIALRTDVVRTPGKLGRETFIFENHLCVVDITRSDVTSSFIGQKMETGVLATASNTISMSNDPATFVPPPKWVWGKVAQDMEKAARRQVQVSRTQ